MKIIGLAVTALMFLSVPAFAVEKTSAAAPNPRAAFNHLPNVSALPEELQTPTVVAYLMTELWPLDVYDMAIIAAYLSGEPIKLPKPGKGKQPRQAK